MKTVFSILLFLSCSFSIAQSTDFEIKEWTNSTDKPLLFYISGDGGFNSFSTELCQSLQKEGYYVIALNAKTYFWKKKTPAETATAIENYIQKKNAGRQNKQIVLAGYSFGADVLPFIVNRLSTNVIAHLTYSILIAASGSTDFEIHWSDMFGSSKKRSMDVADEINRCTGKIAHISATNNEMDESKIRIKNYQHSVLPGSHHFDGNTDALVKMIVSLIKTSA